MAADLHIHVMTEKLTESDLGDFFSHTVGSKWFGKGNYFNHDKVFEKIADSPNIWIGEVSWLKAGVSPEIAEKFIPHPVGQVQKIVGENLPVLDENLLKEIVDAVSTPNQTDYSVADPQEVEEFLKKHLGHRLFTVSW